jgi:hypothetical protein
MINTETPSLQIGQRNTIILNMNFGRYAVFHAGAFVHVAKVAVAMKGSWVDWFSGWPWGEIINIETPLSRQGVESYYSQKIFVIHAWSKKKFFELLK